MTTPCYPNPLLTILPAARGFINPAPRGLSVGVFRLPTDPLFFADIELQNAVVGSRYRVARQSDDLELATGTVPTSTFQILGLPVYANPMLVEIRIRNASGSPAYRPYLGFLSMQQGTNIAYVSQELDE